jgi:hypothetical protein
MGMVWWLGSTGPKSAIRLLLILTVITFISNFQDSLKTTNLQMYLPNLQMYLFVQTLNTPRRTTFPQLISWQSLALQVTCVFLYTLLTQRTDTWCARNKCTVLEGRERRDRGHDLSFLCEDENNPNGVHVEVMKEQRQDNSRSS